MLFHPTVAAALCDTTSETGGAAGAYDALVIGAGATGGLAARLLTEAGLRVLVLDAGFARPPRGTLAYRLRRGATFRLLAPVVYRLLGPKGVDHLMRSPFGRVIARRQAIQSRCYAWAYAPDEFVDDIDCPYVTPPARPFVWLRSRQLGGRMVIPGHGRQYYRLGPNDFSPVDGLSPSWPLQMGELDPWYASVERLLGLAGMRDNIPWQPDSELTYVLSPTPAEEALQRSILARWPAAKPLLGRFAPPPDNLEAAARTGRLLIRTGAIVRKIEVDGSSRVRGVVWIDQKTRVEERASAPLVFLCASALESTRLLLLSGSPRSPDGLGAASGVLGRYLMDHVRLIARGYGPPLSLEPAEDGRCLYLPRFDARESSVPSPTRGFSVQVYHRPESAKRANFIATSFAEMHPRPENRVALDPARRDAWGIPVLRVDCAHGEAELIQAAEQTAALRALADVAGVTLAQIDEEPAAPGSANHECGTARMGSDPSNSVFDPHNECWEAQGLFLTDGACLPSQGTQNPTLTLMALTARACEYAVRAGR